MTSPERDILELLGEAWNRFLALPREASEGGHGDDVLDFRQYIHRLQDMVAARSGYRSLVCPTCKYRWAERDATLCRPCLDALEGR